jgi:DNA-binding Lrp family transcriptional regulator
MHQIGGIGAEFGGGRHYASAGPMCFEGEDDMVTAIVFIKADVARIPEVAEQVAAIEGVSEVYSVTGGLDLIAMIRVAHHDELATVIPDHVNRVPGVLSTETHIAFRAYSSHDLEAAFSLGQEDGV